MEAKDKLGSLRSLAQIHRGQFDERHRYEWKIIFTILSFYVLSAALSCKKGTALPTGTWFHWTVWISFITLAALSSVFLAFIHVANHKNISIAENAENAMEPILNGEEHNLDLFSYGNWWPGWKKLFRGRTWAWFWQTVVLLLFALSCAVVITCH